MYVCIYIYSLVVDLLRPYIILYCQKLYALTFAPKTDGQPPNPLQKTGETTHTFCGLNRYPISSLSALLYSRCHIPLRCPPWYWRLVTGPSTAQTQGRRLKPTQFGRPVHIWFPRPLLSTETCSE